MGYVIMEATEALLVPYSAGSGRSYYVVQFRGHCAILVCQTLMVVGAASKYRV